MGRFAVVKGGVVINVVESDAALAARNGWIKTDVAGKGWTFDGVNFIEPPQAPPPAKSKEDLAREVLKGRPNASPITVKDLKDAGIL